MTDNKQIMRKADWSVADITSEGGLLNPEQTDEFIRKLVHVQPTILRDARVVRMNSPTRKINKIGFNTRIMKAAPSSGTALSSGDRSRPTTEQVTLTTSEVMAEVRLPYDVIEDNIERGSIDDNVAAGPVAGSGVSRDGIKDTIMTLIAERAAIDLEELALLGDTGSGDTYLALQDGWLKLSGVVNFVDNAFATVSKDLFKAGLKTMPDQYLRNLAALRHYVSMDQLIEFRDTYATRETALGDAILQGTGPVFGFGVPVAAALQLPNAQGMLTNPLNLIWGIQRRVTMEVDKDIRTREFIIVVTVRVAVEIEEDEAIVKYINIG